MLISLEDAKLATVEYLRDDLRARLTNPIIRGVINGMANLIPLRVDALLSELGWASAFFVSNGCVNVDALEAFFEGHFQEVHEQPIGKLITVDVDEARRLCAIMRKKQEQQPQEGSAQGNGQHVKGVAQPTT